MEKITVLVRFNEYYDEMCGTVPRFTYRQTRPRRRCVDLLDTRPQAAFISPSWVYFSIRKSNTSDRRIGNEKLADQWWNDCSAIGVNVHRVV